MHQRVPAALCAALTGVLLAAPGCGTPATSGNTSTTPATGANNTVTLYFGSYSVTKQVYEQKIFPAFQKYWHDKTGQTVEFKASFDASGAEARAIASGLPVDVAALSLEDDINKIQEAGLITHDWKADPYHGMVTDSIVAIAVRKGNPKGIHDWSDLAKPGVVVDLPNPQTSGGAKWDINAIYGAGLRTHNEAYAENLLAGIVKNVKVLDKSGEASMTTFAEGTGDAAISYENEILETSLNLTKFDIVIPPSTILIENPVAVIDKNVEKHHNRAVAEAFVEFLRSPEAQELFESAGFRPVNPTVPVNPKEFPKPKDLFTVADLGGWKHLNDVLYSNTGLFNRVLAQRGE